METLKAIVQYKPPVDDSKCKNLYSVSVNKGKEGTGKGRGRAGSYKGSGRGLAMELCGDREGGRSHTKEMSEDSRNWVVSNRNG